MKLQAPQLGQGVLLGPVEPVLIDLAPLKFGAVHPQLLEQ